MLHIRNCRTNSVNIEFWGRGTLNYFQQVQIDDIIEGKKDGMGRRGRRCKQLQTGRYWTLNEEALGCILRRIALWNWL